MFCNETLFFQKERYGDVKQTELKVGEERRKG